MRSPAAAARDTLLVPFVTEDFRGRADSNMQTHNMQLQLNGYMK